MNCIFSKPYYFIGLFLFLQISTSFQLNVSTLSEPFLEEEEPVNDYSSVVSLKYHLIEETLPELFSEIALDNIGCISGECNFSIVNIIEVTHLSNLPTNEVIEALKLLNINSTDVFNIPLIYNVNSDVIQNIMTKFSISFSEVYKNLLSTLSNPSETIPTILNTLNVSVDNFMRTLAFGNDSACVEVLYTGNYSQENVEKVLNLINKTGYELLYLLPVQNIYSNLNKFGDLETTYFLKNLGISSSHLNNFYNYLNVTAINFLSYYPCLNIILDYKDYLNSEDNMGIIISPKEVVTVSNSKALKIFLNQSTRLIKQYSGFHVESVENPLVQYDIENITLENSHLYPLSDGIAVVKLLSRVTSFKNISSVPKNLELTNCTYVSKIPFGLQDEIIPLAKVYNVSIIFPKSNTTKFALGSPLFCNDDLVALAIEELPDHIKLSAVIKPVSEVWSNTTNLIPEISNASTTSNPVTQANRSTLIHYSIFIIFVLFMLIYIL